MNLKFLRSSSSNPESFSRGLSTSRPSTSKTQEGDEHLYETEEVSEQHGKFRGVDFIQTIPKVYYESSFTGSPTPSEMKAPSHKRKDSIGTIKSVDKFIPDLKKINKWWVSPKHALKRAWYVDTYPKEQRVLFKDKWFKDMKRFKTEIEFFKWFEATGQIGEDSSSLQVLVNKWHTKDKVVESITPPLEGLNIPYRKEIIKAAPFKRPSVHKETSIVTVEDINKVFEQNNYTNQALHIVSKQIEESTYNHSGTSKIASKPCSSKSGFNLETNPIFKIHRFSPEDFPKPTSEFSNTPEILERINEQLKRIKISQGDKVDKVVTIKDRLPHSKNFYPRPSFPDVQFEENHMHPQGVADGTSITEWNIDGMVDGQIYNKLQEMGMNVTAYKWK